VEEPSGAGAAFVERAVTVTSDGLALPAGAALPAHRRGMVVALHGLPSTAPRAPDDDGYPGLGRRFAQRGWAALWVRMRAAAGAPGHFPLRGWVRDARAAVAAARRLEPALPLALLGSSAGGAVSLQALVEGAPVDALVLLGTPAEWVSFAATPEAGLLRITRDAGMAVAPEVSADPSQWAAEFTGMVPEEAAARTGVPVLVVHGSDDEVVPVAHAHRLARRAPAAELRVLDGAPHQLRRLPEVVPLVVEWLERVLL
jgi:uncharacterized protein